MSKHLTYDNITIEMFFFSCVLRIISSAAHFSQLFLHSKDDFISGVPPSFALILSSLLLYCLSQADLCDLSSAFLHALGHCLVNGV